MITKARPRPIRRLLAALFIVPLASLLALWGFAASVALSTAIQEHNFNTENARYGGWAQQLFTQLGQERQQTYDWLSTGRKMSEGPLLKQRLATNKAVDAFRAGLDMSPSMILPAARPALHTSWVAISRLPAIRSQVDAGKISAIKAFEDYNAIIEDEFNLYTALVAVNNSTLYQQALASIQAGEAVEMAGREATLISGALLTGDRMGRAERVLFAQTVAERRLLISQATRELNPALGGGYARADRTAAYKAFVSIENAVVASVGSKRPLAISPLTFGEASIALFKDYSAAESQNRRALSNDGTRLGDHGLLEVSLAGGLGLLAVVLSIMLMIRFGRRISRDLTGLQRAALALAEDRLPNVVYRLSQGEDVDVDAEAAPPAAGRIAETARVAEAFSSVQRTAVQAAVGQARLRKGVSQVFRNLAWRSQSLLHRQLALLDTMERRATEPDMLADLFQLDHLTTRMRRHAEGLIILSGAAPGRGWRDPVPIIDVLRGAIAEVEDYTRVNVITESADAVVGAAVADVIHLLAELIENATTYSPASTEVTVKAERVANGFVVEIEDRGFGVADDELQAINQRLANPPEFDLAESDQLGLFVVARLAAKHHIRITMRSSPYGGTAAIVLMPHTIVVVRGPAPAYTNGNALHAAPQPALPAQPAGPVAIAERAVGSPTGIVPAGPALSWAQAGPPEPDLTAEPELTAEPDLAAMDTRPDGAADPDPAGAFGSFTARSFTDGSITGGSFAGGWSAPGGQNGAPADPVAANGDAGEVTIRSAWFRAPVPQQPADEPAGRDEPGAASPGFILTGRPGNGQDKPDTSYTGVGFGAGQTRFGDSGRFGSLMLSNEFGTGAAGNDGDDQDAAAHRNDGAPDLVAAAGPDQAGPGQVGGDQAGPGQVGGDQAGPGQAGGDQAGPDEGGPDQAGGPDALPRRERQAHLAPQLRDGPPAGQAADEPAADPSPANSRSLVQSLQHGWLRGRTDAADADDAWPAVTGQEQALPVEDQEST